MRVKLLSVFLVICIISILLVVTIVTKNDDSDSFAFETPQTNLPKGLKSRIGKGVILDVVYHPDGRQFAVASPTGIWLYDANTFEVKALIATDKPAVKMMAFSSDGEKLATIGESKAIQIWDMETLNHKMTFVSDSSPHYDFYFDFIMFIKDEQTLVSINSGSTHVWDVTTGTHLFEHVNYSSSKSAFSSDGRIAVSCSDSDVYVWDVVERHNLLKKIKIHSPVSYFPKKDFALSSNGTTLAYGTDENTIELWDIETGKHKITLKGHKERVEYIAFSPDGKTLASVSKDHTIILWDVAKGKRKKTLKKHTHEIRKVAFSPDGKTLLSYDRLQILNFWEVGTGKLIYSLRDHINIATSISMSPDGLTLVSGGLNGYIHLWDVTTGKHKKTFKGHKKTVKGYINSVTSVSYSPDGLTIASASLDKSIHLWDAATGKRKNSIAKPSGNVRNVIFSPVDQLLVIATDKSIQVWEIDPLQLLYAPIAYDPSPYYQGLSSYYQGLSLSADGKSIASTGKSQTIKIWNVAKGNLMRTTKLKDSWRLTKNIALSPDSKIIASLSPHDNTFGLWNVVTGEHKHSLKNIHNLKRYGIYLNCVYSPDGNYLLAGCFHATLTLWDATTGKLVKSLKGFSHTIRDIVFSKDGKTLITSGDGTVLVWDFATLINGSDQ